MWAWGLAMESGPVLVPLALWCGPIDEARRGELGPRASPPGRGQWSPWSSPSCVP